MKVVLACAAVLCAAAGSSGAELLEKSSSSVHNNLAYESPHADAPHLAMPFPHELNRRALRSSQSCASSVSFVHGVASGDPYADSVLLWTRLTPQETAVNAVYDLQYTVSKEPGMGGVVAQGKVKTSANVDFTVKVIAGGLDSNTKYYYQFTACGGAVKSPVGTTQTAADHDEDVDSVNFATVSCSSYETGFFNAYGRIADKADSLNFVMHLGDYIYEYANRDNRPQARQTEPNKEVVTLQDYRIRYSLYTKDKDLQRMRQVLPLIAIPDDHEVTNDGYREGAQNHQPETEGVWEVRVNNALRAWFEWIPTRKFYGKDKALYRDFQFGKRVQLSMIDPRYESKDMQPPSDPARAITTQAEIDAFLDASKQRQIMSDTQMDWLIDTMHAPQQWRVIGNTIPFSDLVDFPSQAKPDAFFLFVDQWIAYKKSQSKLLDGIEDVDNVIIHTGDFHDNFVIESFEKPNGKPYAVEFVVHSVTSNGFGNNEDPKFRSREFQRNLIRENRWIYDVSFRTQKGYAIHEYKKDAVYAQYYAVQTVQDPEDTGEYVFWDYKVCDGTGRVQRAVEDCKKTDEL